MVTWVTSVSCATTGNCAAGVYWFTKPNRDKRTLSNNHACLVMQTRGTWDGAQPVLGLAALGSREAKAQTVSCQPLRGCITIDDYFAHGHRLFTAFRG